MNIQPPKAGERQAYTSKPTASPTLQARNHDAKINYVRVNYEQVMNENNLVMATLEVYATAYCAKDIDALMHVFDSGESISLVGTDSDLNKTTEISCQSTR